MYYWVNQGKTYKEEKAGGYLWAPIKNSKGNSFFHWENMTKLKPTDIVFHYCRGFVVGLYHFIFIIVMPTFLTVCPANK